MIQRLWTKIKNVPGDDRISILSCAYFLMVFGTPAIEYFLIKAGLNSSRIVLVIYLGIILPLFLYGVKYIFSKLNFYDVFLLLFFLLLLAFSWLYRVNNKSVILEYLMSILSGCLPLYFLFRVFPFTFKSVKMIKYIAPLCVVFSLAFSLELYVSEQTAVREMTMAYMSCFLGCFVFSFAVFSRRWVNKLFWLICLFVIVVSIIIYGSRGPLLCLISYSLFEFFRRGLKTKKSRYTAFLILVLFSFSFLALYNVIAPPIVAFLVAHGVGGRITNLSSLQSLFSLDYRDSLFEMLAQSLIYSPSLGYGVFGEWSITMFGRYNQSGIYAHNILLSFFTEFGVFVGPLAFLLLCALLYSAYRNTENSFFVNEALAVFFFSSFLKLFLSGSYLVDPTFWAFLGCAVTALTRAVNKPDSSLKLN